MSGDRCAVTELLCRECACSRCRPDTAPPLRSWERPGRVFVALYPGVCGRCESRFEAGVRIVALADGGGYAHADEEECRS